VSKHRLVIIGAGGFGREILCWAHDYVMNGGAFSEVAFVDDAVEQLQQYGLWRIASLQDYSPETGDRIVIGVGMPATKRKMVELIQSRGGQFGDLIHPTSVLGKTSKRGIGILMCPFSMNTADTVAGDFVTILSFSGIGHDSRVGHFTTIASHVDVMGNVEIGNEVFVGSGARILPGLRVRDQATIGAGATVMRNVKAGQTVYMPPAKTLNVLRT
jgi:sugar O-acyltransferase (sialic acid O-acetyltransferase NeuD family)